MVVELQKGGYALLQGRSRKTIIQLKLTDSALRAIECYEDNLQIRQKEKPKIRFERNQGMIQIPASDRNETQSFTFQLSTLNQSAYIHCLQQYATGKAAGMMSVLGEMQQKITVKATDDSYNATKKRIEIAKELEKNVSTKVIKQPSSSKLGKKQPLRRKVLDQKSGGSQFIHSRTSTPPPGKTSLALSSSRSVSPLIPPNRSVSPVSGGDLAGVRNKTKPILSSISSKPPPGAGRPLQERVLHHIALRPIKLQDLVAKLSKGTAMVDRAKVQSILQQIAQSRPARAGAPEFSLRKNLYNELQPDWCGFNDEEKALVKRKLTENARVAAEARKRVGVSETTPKSSPVYPNKRELEEETYSNPLKKKARVSLYNKTSPNISRPRSVSPLESAPPLSLDPSSHLFNSSSLVQLKDSDVDRLGLPPNGPTRPKRPLSANSKAAKSNADDAKRISPLTTSLLPPSDSFPASSPFSTVKSDDYSSQKSPTDLPTLNSNEKVRKVANDRIKVSQNAPHNEAGIGSEVSDFKNSLDADVLPDLKSSKDEFIEKYPPINYAEQRDRYKKDFSAEYKEYIVLHQKVVSQCKRFGEWQHELSQEERNTDTYKTIARRVYAEYMRLKKDKKFHEERERRDYLHRKLKYIKKLVLEYDSKQFAKHDGLRQGGSERESKPHHRPTDVTRKRAVVTA